MKAKPTVIIGSDHGGHATKEYVKKDLAKLGYTIVDVGGFSDKTPDDYPEYAKLVGHAVRSDTTGRTLGILVCGTGTGMAIAANRLKGVRAAVAYDHYSAKMARHDNDANVLALRGRRFAKATAAAVARTFLASEFSKIPRHKRRVRQVEGMR